jgi:hypothetical protein
MERKVKRFNTLCRRSHRRLDRDRLGKRNLITSSAAREFHTPM